ncbi:MAG TPA: hypothetical protein VEY67_11945 [Candidatus Dormibacteraeota bacterium]|nr:hypothetical protein [Candidatus Dormibacteraeota bacterium]
MRRNRLAVLTLAALSLAACTAGGAASPSPSPSAAYSVLPVIISQEQVVGTNRFVFSFLDAENKPVASPDRTASVKAWPDAKGPSAAVSGQGRFLWAVQGVTGMYVTSLAFAEAGQWSAEFTTAAAGKPTETIPFTFDVVEHGTSVQVGQQAPSVRTPTLADVGGDVKAISSDTQPDPAFYQVSEDAALAAHKPFVLIFATPAFCTSRACGPLLDEVKAASKSASGVTFINVEPYKLQYANGQLQPVLDTQGQLQPVPAVDKFGILSEPWIFVVDRTGKVTGSFEGVVGTDELAAAIKAIE